LKRVVKNINNNLVITNIVLLYFVITLGLHVQEQTKMCKDNTCPLLNYVSFYHFYFTIKY